MKASLVLCAATALAGTVLLETHRDNSRQDNNGRGNALFREIYYRKADAASPISDSLANAIDLFYTTLYLGSDHQKVIPMIDTGSSDLWVMEKSNPYCVDNPECIGMDFNSSLSTTFKNTTKPWDVEYLDSTGAFGFLCEDTVEISGASVPNSYFAVADIANSTSGVFGIGYVDGEAPDLVNSNTSYTYPNFPINLKQAGLINTIAYSLYLNNEEAKEGAVLFGGVDHAKHYGTLGVVPIINMAPWVVDNPYSFFVMFNGFGVNSGSTTCPLVTNVAFPVLFDSGTTLAILPNVTVSALAQAYGYTWSEEDQFFEGSCDLFDFDSFELDFSGIKVHVNPQGLLMSTSEEGKCALGIAIDDAAENFIMGDIFMRNFYLVYDLEHNQIAIGQAKYTDESDIEEIVSTIPSVTTAPNYSSTPVMSREYFHEKTYLSNISVHNAGACETKTYTSEISTPTTFDLSSFYYGQPTATATTTATA